MHIAMQAPRDPRCAPKMEKYDFENNFVLLGRKNTPKMTKIESETTKSSKLRLLDYEVPENLK